MTIFGGRNARQSAPGYSVIDDRLSIRGELDTDGTVRVDGRVEGAVHRAGTLIVGSRGSLIGDVEAGDVVIAGMVQGDIQASGRVEIESGATVHGAIRAASMALSEGGIVHGQVAIGPLPAAPEVAGGARRLEITSAPAVALPSGRPRG